MSGHVHAHLMALYAQDAAETDKPWRRWERKVSQEDGVKWVPFITHPSWIEYCEYRRKPKTININGFEVPEPHREPLEIGQRYWLADPSNSLVEMYHWDNVACEIRCLRAGLIHITKEAAEIHRKALLSFTEVKS